jgi:hypothetical protein
MSTPTLRYFLTYRGVSLPLTLAEELEPESLRNRNTYFQAAYTPQGQTLWIEKRVYGEVELRHDYRWSAEGQLEQVTIHTPDEEPHVLSVGPRGKVV